MSWQRIDENTYIDDTLVTCAEYQLFIDEMREQGRYYQPDHWNSFQFPKGEAREPILGVRYSDVFTFCKWLTQRDGGASKYRIPIQEEAMSSYITHPSAALLGYWVAAGNGYPSIVWIGHIPFDPRQIDRDFELDIQIDGALQRANIRGVTFDHEFVYDLDNIRDRLRKVNPVSILSSRIAALYGFYDSVRNLEAAITLTRDRAIAFDNDFAIVLNRDINSRYDTNQNHTLPEVDFVYDFNLYIDHDIACRHALYLVREIIRVSDIARDITGMSNVKQEISGILERSLDFFIDLLTLQERIGGRSPAFEGIRLVKERIR